MQCVDTAALTARRIVAWGIDILFGALALLIGLAFASTLSHSIYGISLTSPQDGSEAWHDGLWLLVPALLPLAAVIYYNHVFRIRRFGRSLGMHIIKLRKVTSPVPRDF